MAAIRMALHKTLNRIELALPSHLRPYWNHECGPKTIFFWAPWIKWGLVIAGLSDMTRPAELLSVPQSAVLGVSGFIWSRYCFVIIPKNFNLFAVNFFVGCCGTTQLVRIWLYQKSLQEKGAAQPTDLVSRKPAGTQGCDSLK
uniref:mitochondrial pyruvate carrier 2-like n=1 Tax=Myxine glutinosa TaxID=7769 RepID=UPI00358E5304